MMMVRVWVRAKGILCSKGSLQRVFASESAPAILRPQALLLSPQPFPARFVARALAFPLNFRILVAAGDTGFV